jgi:structural maintenance of chromosome 2
LLKEEIDPKLEKLRAEKRSYLEYQKTSSELERLTRLVKAYEWTLAVEKTEKAKQNLAKAQRKLEECKEEIERGGKECAGMESEMKEIEKRRERVSPIGRMVAMPNTDVIGTCQRWKSAGLD